MELNIFGKFNGKVLYFWLFRRYFARKVKNFLRLRRIFKNNLKKLSIFMKIDPFYAEIPILMDNGKMA